MKLHREQKRAIEAALLLRFVDEVAAAVHELDLGGARALDAKAQRERVRVAVERARSLGVQTRDGLRIFAFMSFDLAPDFHEAPAVQQILRAPSASEAERFDALCRHLYGVPGTIGGLR